MTQLKTIIVDDEPRGLKSLEKLLGQYCENVEVLARCSSGEDAIDAIFDLQPQLVLLDIAMPGKTGLDVLSETAGLSYEVIFVTAHENYMTQAFRYSAIDYLMKPVDETLLQNAVRRATKRIEEKAGNAPVQTLLSNVNNTAAKKLKLCITSLKGFVVVNISDILYCASQSNYTIFHFTNGKELCSTRALQDYEDMLSDSHFVRLHKSFLINLEHLQEYVRGDGGYVILQNGTELEVSRRRKDILMQRLSDYYKM